MDFSLADVMLTFWAMALDALVMDMALVAKIAPNYPENTSVAAKFRTINCKWNIVH